MAGRLTNGSAKNNCQLAEAKLLYSYEGLELCDPQHDVKYTVLSCNLDFVHDRRSCGWSLFLVPSLFVDDGHDDDDICGYMIDDETAGVIADIEQNSELNVQIISSAAKDDDDDDDDDDA
jgi:hypothetical protein